MINEAGSTILTIIFCFLYRGQNIDHKDVPKRFTDILLPRSLDPGLPVSQFEHIFHSLGSILVS